MSVKYSSVGKLTCRLCLQNVDVYLNILESNYRLLLKELTSLELMEDDDFPKIACISCIHELQLANKIKQRIIKCYKNLERIFQISHGSRRPVEDERKNNYKEEFTQVFSSNEEQYSRFTNNYVEECDQSIDHFNKSFSKDETDFPTKEKGIEKTVEKIETYIYKKCGINFGNDQEAFKLHISTHEKTNCVFCDHVIKSENMEKHLKSHEESPVMCDICGKVYKNSSSLRNHIFFAHKTPPDRFKCDKCHKTYKKNSVFKAHRCKMLAGSEKKVEERARICDVCGKTYKNIKHLRYHIYKAHKSLSDRYKCNECSKAFMRKTDLFHHELRVHKGIRKHSCQICDKKFVYSSEVKRHIKMTHMKLRPYKCEHCEKSFASMHSLKTHILWHKDERPIKCPVCAKGFRQRYHVHKHMKVMHNIEEKRNYSCEHCGRKFASNFGLSSHLNQHTDRYYECKECKEYFLQKIFLVNHLKNVHNLDEEVIDVKNYQTNISKEAGEISKQVAIILGEMNTAEKS